MANEKAPYGQREREALDRLVKATARLRRQPKAPTERDDPPRRQGD